jgi:hypothetical protein
MVDPSAAGDNRPMQVAIRCHPYAPVASTELEQWLDREITELRAGAPHATIRLLRLSQPGNQGRLVVGWLIELEGTNGEAPLDEHDLRAILRDMRLLGLQPSVLS